MFIKDEEIGGGRVARRFNRNGKDMLAGMPLTAEEILAMAPANRRALIDSHYIEVYPKSSAGGERFMIGLGGDKGYNVIEGRILNDAPLSRKDAEKLLNS